MSRSSYTASERRGVLAIALIALLIIGCGAGFSLFSGDAEDEKEIPMVTANPEMVDSVAVKTKQKKGRSKKKKSRSKRKKEYRQRSPLDEPV